MTRFHWVITVAALATAACSSSTDVECQPGYELCGGACVAVFQDPWNCGACGVTCGATQACVEGACVADCRASLHDPIRDPWGFWWDGLERPAATHPQARDACAALGGRLPTVSELYRVSAALDQTASVGDGYKTNQLWSLTPHDNANAHRVQLSSGSVVISLFGTANTYYRCVCPPPRPAAFVEGACYGDPDAGCAPLVEDGRFNFDAEDRPLVSKAGAIFECALAGGELPTAERLVAAVSGGLPNGSNNPLHTADDTGPTTPVEAQVRFSGTTPATVAEGSLVVQQRFRCFGPASATAEAALVAGGFQEPRGERVADGADSTAMKYSGAIGDCFAKGGHLPTATELAAFAMQGLPSGAATGARWSSDQLSGGTAMTFAWSGVARWPLSPTPDPGSGPTDGVPYAWSAASLQQLLRSDATGLPYRCIYHGVDRAYPPPPDGECSGNDCVPFVVGPSTSPRRMWFDLSNRGGTLSDTWATAVAACAALGGRLPSARDLVEAIRSGLNGTGDTLITADLVGGGPLVRTVTWNGTQNSEFDDVGTTTVTLAATAVKYRCMWTNEVR